MCKFFNKKNDKKSFKKSEGRGHENITFGSKLTKESFTLGSDSDQPKTSPFDFPTLKTLNIPIFKTNKQKHNVEKNGGGRGNIPIKSINFWK